MGIDASALFQRHALTVYRYLRRMTGRADLAEDLTQDVFLRIVRGGDRYEARDRERAWVLRIAHNVLIDSWHEAKRASADVSLADVDEPSSEAVHVLALGFEEALRLLPPVERAVFLLRERGGLTYAEIAVACDLTTEAVRSKLYRARREIKRRLSGRLSAGRPGVE